MSDDSDSTFSGRLFGSTSQSKKAHKSKPSRHHDLDVREKNFQLKEDGPPTYELFKKRQEPKGLSGRKLHSRHVPAVLWTTKVCDYKDHGYERLPSLVFHDDRPIHLSSGIDDGADDGRDLPGTGRRAAQYGSHCVLEIVSDFAARFPGLVPLQDIGEQILSRLVKQERHQLSESHVLEYRYTGSTTLVMRSGYLLHRLAEMSGYYPSFASSASEILRASKSRSPDLMNLKVKIPRPYNFLMHHYPQIEFLAAGSLTENRAGMLTEGLNDSKAPPTHVDIRKIEREELFLLYSFLKPIYESSILPAQKLLESHLPQTTFDELWFVFRPGTDVYLSQGEVTFAAVVSRVRNHEEELEGRSRVPRFQEFRDAPLPWTIELWYLKTIRLKIVRCRYSVQISPFVGLRAITSLEVCPAHIWDSSDNCARRHAILQRSELLVKAIRQGHLLAQYQGAVDGERQYKGNVIVDFRYQQRDTKLLRYKSDGTHFVDYDNIVLDGEGHRGQGTLPGGYPGGGSHRDEPSVGDDFRKGFANNDPSQSGWNFAGRNNPPESRRTVRRDSESSYFSDFDQDTDDTTLKMQQDLTEHQKLLFFPRVPAFGLKTKTWFYLNPDHIQALDSSRESLDHLVMESQELDVLRSICKRHKSRRNTWAADFIDGKGTGQVVLLHGPPGVGKTYTVEAIAEWMHCPVLSLTIADIGTAEAQIEYALIYWFGLAEAWNAVVLVDEADVFLERRQNRDLARNGLVSAFLRRMEYFSGLVFLTTNRVGQIDDAFISRVHVAVGYRALNGEGRQRIWTGFLQKLARERPGKIQIAMGAKRWVLDTASSDHQGQSMNGRDIRNALQTAITLAEAEAEDDPDFDPETMAVVVEQSHFERVLGMSHRFQEYVKSIRREDEKKRAAGRADRNDYYWQDGAVVSR